MALLGWWNIRLSPMAAQSTLLLLIGVTHASESTQLDMLNNSDNTKKFVTLSDKQLTDNNVEADEGHKYCLIKPETQGNYRYVLDEVSKGVFSRIENIITITVPKNAKTSAGVANSSCKGTGMITLGTKSLAFGRRANPNSIVAGMVPFKTPQKGIIQIEYTAPANLFIKNLKTIKPSIRTIHVMHRVEGLSDRYRNSIQDAANNHNTEVIFHKISDSRSRGKQYQSVINLMHADFDALWIQSDKYNRDFYLVLNWILKESWRKRLVVFSSNLTPVKRGALFSLYPDNFDYGQRLAEVASARINGAPQITANTASLNTAKLAINRVALSRITGSLELMNTLDADFVFPIVD